jgi:hypothetical protein
MWRTSHYLTSSGQKNAALAQAKVAPSTRGADSQSQSRYGIRPRQQGVQTKKTRDRTMKHKIKIQVSIEERGLGMRTCGR